MTTSKNEYRGYTVRYSEKKQRFEGKKGNRIIFTNKEEKWLKKSIDSWLANVECSKRIAAIPQGKSPNPNVIRK